MKNYSRVLIGTLVLLALGSPALHAQTCVEPESPYQDPPSPYTLEDALTEEMIPPPASQYEGNYTEQYLPEMWEYVGFMELYHYYAYGTELPSENQEFWNYIDPFYPSELPPAEPEYVPDPAPQLPSSTVDEFGDPLEPNPPEIDLGSAFGPSPPTCE